MEKGGTVPKAEIWEKKGAVSLLTLGRWGGRNRIFFAKLAKQEIQPGFPLLPASSIT